METDGALKTTQQFDQALKLIKSVQHANPTTTLFVRYFDKHLMASFRYINRYQ